MSRLQDLEEQLFEIGNRLQAGRASERLRQSEIRAIPLERRAGDQSETNPVIEDSRQLKREGPIKREGPMHLP